MLVLLKKIKKKEYIYKINRAYPGNAPSGVSGYNNVMLERHLKFV